MTLCISELASRTFRLDARRSKALTESSISSQSLCSRLKLRFLKFLGEEGCLKNPNWEGIKVVDFVEESSNLLGLPADVASELCADPNRFSLDSDLEEVGDVRIGSLSLRCCPAIIKVPMSKRSVRYMEAGDSEDSTFNQEVALAIVRRLQVYDVCSFEWMKIAKEISQLVEFSDSELTSKPDSTYDISQRLGRGVKDTLWDTSTCSAVPKHIVDENKVNLLLTLAKDFKDWQRIEPFDIRVRAEASKLQIPLDHLLLELNLFEANIGKLLGRVFSYVEGLQQANHQSLCQHIIAVVIRLASSHAVYDDNLQEGQVFNYLTAIFENSSHLTSEEELMERLDHSNLFPAILRYILSQQANMQRPFLVKVLTALAASAETDVFMSNFSIYFGDNLQEKEAFIAFRLSFIRDLIVEDPTMREKLRGLLEATDLLEREIRLKKKNR